MSTRRKFHSMRFQFFTALSMHAAMEPAYQSRLDRLGRLAYLIIPQTQVLNSPENPTGWAVTSSIANSFQIKSNSISLAELTITSLLRLVGTWYTCLEMETESGIGNCLAWAARDPSGVLSPYQFHRRPVASDDVALKIKYCGVCFADVSWTRNLYHDSMYPLVPGHEITGVVTEVGSNVTRFKAGDLVGVGTYVNSCTTCEHCNNFLEIHCKKCVYTFNAIDNDGTVTKGGYSTHIVVRDRYCFKIPDGYPLELAAPLLCAGITVYKPMMHHKMNQPGKSLGVVGSGGLGHMAIKFGKSFGLNVTVFSTSESKRDEAINILGVDKFVLSSDTQQMQEMEGKLDFIVDTAAGNHPFDPYLNTLKVHGIMVLVAFPSHEIKLSPASLNLGARSLAGSLTGGTKDIQSMLEYCAAHKVHPKIELIKIDSINEALERMIKRDVRYRFVIDIENSFI